MGKRNGVDNLIEAIENEEKKLNFYQYVLSQPIKLKNRDFSFKGFEELEQIYQDMHPNMVFRKGVQIGITTYVLLRIFWRANALSAKGIYYVPSDEFLKKFVPDRVNPVLKCLPDVKAQLLTDSKELKELGFAQTSVYFCGLNTKSNVASVDADTLVFDEFDISNQTLQTEAKDRLMRSRFPEIIMLSKPSIPGFGIDREFQDTDQHFRLMKCPKCGKWNDVIERFPDCLKPRDKTGTTGYLACKCGAELDPRQAKWVPKKLDNKRRGYHLSQLYWTWIPPDYESVGDMAYQMYEKAGDIVEKGRVYQSVAGLPFAGELKPITDKVLDRAHGTYDMIPFANHGFLGFDQGDDIHIVILHLEGDLLVVHWVEKARSFSRLYELMTEHNIWCAVGDALPNKHSAKDWAWEHLGYAYIQYFNYNEKGVRISKEIKDADEEEQVDVVTVDRTESLNRTVSGFLKNKFVLPRQESDPEMEVLRDHLKNAVRERRTTSKGERIVYKEGVPNHYLMALNSARIATQLPVVRPFGMPLLAEGGNLSVY